MAKLNIAVNIIKNDGICQASMMIITGFKCTTSYNPGSLVENPSESNYYRGGTFS